MTRGWFQTSESTTQDILQGVGGVYLETQDGDTNIGMITRKNGSFLAVSQKLIIPLEKVQCYEMSLYLAKVNNYGGCNQLINLRMWQGTGLIPRVQLLSNSKDIISENWKCHKIEFIPKLYSSEVYGDTGVNQEGYILLDNTTQFKRCRRA